MGFKSYQICRQQDTLSLDWLRIIYNFLLSGRNMSICIKIYLLGGSMCTQCSRDIGHGMAQLLILTLSGYL